MSIVVDLDDPVIESNKNDSKKRSNSHLEQYFTKIRS